MTSPSSLQVKVKKVEWEFTRQLNTGCRAGGFLACWPMGPKIQEEGCEVGGDSWVGGSFSGCWAHLTLEAPEKGPGVMADFYAVRVWFLQSQDKLAYH